MGIQGSMAGTSLANMIRYLQLSLVNQKKERLSLGASSVVSAADAAGASVAAALFLERRVRVAFLAVAVLAMFSS